MANHKKPAKLTLIEKRKRRQVSRAAKIKAETRRAEVAASAS